MYYPTQPFKTVIHRNTSKPGDTIEIRVMKILNNKEPISDGANPIYTERKDGVLPEYNIKTDRFDIAIDAMDKIAKGAATEREKRIVSRQTEKMNQTTATRDAGTAANTQDSKTQN